MNFMKKNEVLKVKIEDYTEEGFGVARADGYVLFIPNTVAGEEAEVLVVKAGKRFGYAKVLNLLTRSPHRVESDCPLGHRCGGCAFWHLSYEEELRLKASRCRPRILRSISKTCRRAHRLSASLSEARTDLPTG